MGLKFHNRIITDSMPMQQIQYKKSNEISQISGYRKMISLCNLPTLNPGPFGDPQKLFYDPLGGLGEIRVRG